MNFRQCVIDCIAGGEVVQSFNRLHGRPITPQLLSKLSTGEPQGIAELGDTEQELLACFILFVHRHIWRKMKFAESRVTRVTRIREESEPGERHSSLLSEGVRSFVRCDAPPLLAADRINGGASLGQQST